MINSNKKRLNNETSIVRHLRYNHNNSKAGLYH